MKLMFLPHVFDVSISECSSDHAGGRGPAGADCAGRCAGTGSSADYTVRWTDYAGHATDHHQHGRDSADSSKNFILFAQFIMASFCNQGLNLGLGNLVILQDNHT